MRRRSAILTIAVLLAAAPAASGARPADSVLDSDDRVVVHGTAERAAAAPGVRALVRGLLDRLGPDTGLPAPLADADGRLDVYLTTGGSADARDDGPRAGGDGRTAYLVVGADRPAEELRTDAARAVARAALLGIDADEVDAGWWTGASLTWAATRLGGTHIVGLCDRPECLVVDVLPRAAPGVIAAVWERLRTLGAGQTSKHADEALAAELQARGIGDAALAAAVAQQPFTDDGWRREPCVLSRPAGGFGGVLPVAPWSPRVLVLRLGTCAPMPAGGATLQLTAAGSLAADARAIAWREGQPPQSLGVVVGPGGGATVDVPLDPLPDAVAIGMANARPQQRDGGLGFRWTPRGLPPVFAIAYRRATCRRQPRGRQRCTLTGTFASSDGVTELRVGLLRRLGRGRCLAPMGTRGLRPRRCPAAGHRAPSRPAALDLAARWRLAVTLPRGRARWRLELRARNLHRMTVQTVLPGVRIGR